MAEPKQLTSPRSYRAHRDRQRRRILDAAMKLFDERGIDRTAVLDIVTASGLRASTIYEYFSKKDDIVWAILGDYLEQDSRIAREMMEAAQTGLAKIGGLLRYMAQELAHNPAKVRFMAQFDAMYARDWPVEDLLTLEGQLNGDPDLGGFKVFARLISEGIADGSLRPDLDPALTLHAVVNAAVGAQRRLASLGSKVEDEYGQPVVRLFEEMIRILLLGLSSMDQTSPASARPGGRNGKKGKKTL